VVHVHTGSCWLDNSQASNTRRFTRYTFIRLLMALAAKYDLDIDQMDVTTVFLHPELDEEIFMKLPTATIKVLSILPGIQDIIQ